MRIPFGELVQGMMHDLAAHGVVGEFAERLQRFEPKDAAGEDGVGIGQHMLDARDAQPAWPGLDGRTGTWWIDRLEGRGTIALAGPRCPRLLWRDAALQLRCLDQGV